jgi:hypothetical protein
MAAAAAASATLSDFGRPVRYASPAGVLSRFFGGVFQLSRGVSDFARGSHTFSKKLILSDGPHLKLAQRLGGSAIIITFGRDVCRSKE